MSILALLRTGVLVVLGMLPLAALAQITIDVGAQEEPAFSDGRTFDLPVKRAWGRAEASMFGGLVLFGEGSLACPLATCGPFITGPGASAAARADATKMNVGVRAYAASAPWLTDGIAEVSILDTLSVTSAGTLILDIRLDLALAATGSSDAIYNFGISLGSGDDKRGVFAFQASEKSGVRTAQMFLNDGATIVDLPAVPSSFDHIVEVPIIFTPGLVPIEVTASAHADSRSGESSFVDAFNSAWLGISGVSYSSLNGYSYPGFAAAVPEPTPAALLLAGLAFVVLAANKRRIRPI